MGEVDLLRNLGEETIYSAKGHFKACDVRRQLVTYTIWGCMFLSLISFGFCNIHPIVDKIFAFLGVFGTGALLIWNEGEGKDYRSKHKAAGEKYLALHKEIRDCYAFSPNDVVKVAELSEKVRVLDQSEKPEIPGFARKFAKRAIERKDPETNNWFKKVE